MQTFLWIVFIWLNGYLIALAVLKRLIKILDGVFDKETMEDWRFRDHIYYWAIASWCAIICFAVVAISMHVHYRMKK